MTKGKKQRKNDPVYDGFQHAMNQTNILNNPDAFARLKQASGIGIAESMRYITDRKKSKAEEEKEKQNARLDKLKS